MRAYQEEYLRLLAGTAQGASLEAVERGTALLRENLFPVLDDILDADDQELADLYEFAEKLMGRGARDVGLHYRVHLALMDYARHAGRTDMLLRELYKVGMSLYDLETVLVPDHTRLFCTRMRLCFTECASYFGTPQYDELDAESRGYVHRSMGNIALAYHGGDPASTRAKLAAVTRSIRVLSDPDVRAKTPELPWDTYLYKSHQERTSLLSSLRRGDAGPETYAQVLESAQIVQERQLAAFRERGVPPEPRWQYAYMAARYHCGAMLLPELLDGLYALSRSKPENDFSDQGIYAYVGAPAYFMEYAKGLPKTEAGERDVRVERMTRRMRAYLYALPPEENGDFLLFNLRQFLYIYNEDQGGTPFFELLQDFFATRNPAGCVRQWLMGCLTQTLTGWAVEDCPEKLAGLCGTGSAGEVRERRQELEDFAMRAGCLADAGMIHLFRMETYACRGLFEEEEALLRLHTHLGANLLRGHSSTRDFADIALGHHRAFDERSGYPLDFSALGLAVRPMICLVSVADCLAASDPDTAARSRPALPFDEAVERVQNGAGTVYAPFAAALLTSPDRRELLRRSLPVWKAEALADLRRRVSEQQ